MCGSVLFIADYVKVGLFSVRGVFSKRGGAAKREGLSCSRFVRRLEVHFIKKSLNYFFSDQFIFFEVSFLFDSEFFGFA